MSDKPVVQNIEAEQYSLKIYPIAKGIWRHDFLKKIKSAEHRFDIFPDSWNFAVFEDLRPGQVHCFSLGERFPVLGGWGVLLPPFSPVEWELWGNFRLSSLRWKSPQPVGFPNYAVAFPVGDWELPDSIESVLQKTRQMEKEWVPLCQTLYPSAVSIKAKRFIDQNYFRPFLISKCARQMGAGREIIARYFSRDFGLSPVDYRNRLRVSKSLELFSELGHSVTDTCHKVGFTDLSTFNKQFKKYIEHIPSDFRANFKLFNRRQKKELELPHNI